MLSTTLASMRDFAYILDPDARFLFANRPLLELWGLPLEEVVGKSFFDLGYPVALAEKLQGQVREVCRGKTSVMDETPYTSATGEGGHFEYVFSPAFGKDEAVEFVVGTSRDITERRKVEEALRARVEQFSALAEAMPQMVWIARPDRRNTYINRQWMDYTGLTLEESLGEAWSKPFHPDDQARASTAWERATATGGTYTLECRLRRADGIYRWWLIRSVPVKDAAGVVVKWFATATDIHDLKVAVTTQETAERKLKESEERYRRLFDSNPHAMWVFDAETLAFLAVNDAAIRLYGFSRDEFLEMTIKDIRSPE
jgi:PAS domain S-box-containing protein